MKILQIACFSQVSLLLVVHGAINVTTIDVADDVAWPIALDYAVTDADNPDLYDARALSIEGADGLVVQSVRIFLDTTGAFDDSIALDIDADDTIDFISTQDDAYSTEGIGSGTTGYRPWDDASLYTFDAVITATGTTLTTYWNGVAIDVGGASSGDVGFNNVSSFTLSDWGFGEDGTIVGDDFTTGTIRLGNVNTDGPGLHDISFTFDAVVIEDVDGNTYVFDPDGDGVPSVVPEPAAYTLMTALLVFGFCMRRR
jgi:hypothetical protein